MAARFRNIGLAFSALALFFTALYLPFHHHQDSVKDCGPAHCSVCHFTKEGKTVSSAGPVAGEPAAVHAIPVQPRVPVPDLGFSEVRSSRAPPSV